MAKKNKQDKMVDMPIDLTDEEFLAIAKMAHERDITFNKMIETILWSYINEYKSKIPTLKEEVPKNE